MKKIFTLLAVLMLFLNGKSQTTLSFDGTDDYVAINKSYSSPISALTAEVWFKTSFTTAGDFSNWALICFDRSEYWHFSIEGDGRIGFHSTSVTGASINFLIIYGDSISSDSILLFGISTNLFKLFTASPGNFIMAINLSGSVVLLTVFPLSLNLIF